ncbi:copper chaperone PCu(A)C [Alcanivorax sediminis]|nr:copper chaperone PCu(A)C [Alcanivorax sediminis]
MLKVFSKGAVLVSAMAWAATAQAELVLSEAWLRAVPPVSPTMAGYVTVTNTGEAAVMITGAQGDFAGHVMLHDMSVQQDGTRAMRHLHAVEVPAGESVSFAPGGMHLMLMHLSRVPAEGEQARLCLELKEGAPVCADFTVSGTSPFEA